MRILKLTLVFLLLSGSIVTAETVELASPDGHLKLTFEVAAEGGVTQALAIGGKPVISPSPVGFAGGRFSGTERRTEDSVWKPVWGKRSVVRERYSEATIDLGTYRLQARAYDDGVAFRYGFAGAKPTSAEATAFHFAGDFTAWYYNGENHNIGPEKLSTTKGRRLPVATIRTSDNDYLALHEADLFDGEPMILEGTPGQTLLRVVSKPNSSWRVIMFGRTPGALVDSHLIELLNPPPPSDMDFSWVKPGVAVWDWRINGAKVNGFRYEMSLPSWKRMVDFASENRIPHLVLDANWYGPEFSTNSDPIKGGKVDQVREIITYGKSKSVGIWLYLNDIGGRKFDLEQTLKQYSEWGAAGVKYGFMRGSPEEKNRRTHLITELCAKYKLLCNYHDGPVHPTGQMRTWPNAVTREYCQAQLDGHKVFQPRTFVTSVFVNMLAGPLDMNNGLADLTQAGRVDHGVPVPSTLSAEVARTLIVFSGATIIPDIPENYRKHPELLQFIAAQKMPWRESKTLAGEIGEFIVMARQAADGAWLIAAATNESPRELRVPLSFLPAGNYEALVIQDGPNSDYRTHAEDYQSDTRDVSQADTLQLKLAPGGGSCVLIKPKPVKAAAGGFLFVTFKGQENPLSEQVYFNISEDGRAWTALNQANPVLVSNLGEKGVRDPYLLRSHDEKKFYLIGTDLSWARDRSGSRAIRAGSRSLVIWESTDLVRWSEPRLVAVAPSDAGCAWAPEAIYDEEKGEYLVFWASTTKRDNFAKHRIWSARTKDFKQFSEPEVYIDRPFPLIDTTIVREGSRYFRWTKREDQAVIIAETSDRLNGDWKPLEGFSLASMRGVEGPQCYLLRPASGDRPAQWCLLLDHYRGGGYKAYVTDHLAGGQFKPTDGATFPFPPRHGSVIALSAEEYAKLKQELPATTSP